MRYMNQLLTLTLTLTYYSAAKLSVWAAYSQSMLPKGAGFHCHSRWWSGYHHHHEVYFRQKSTETI